MKPGTMIMMMPTPAALRLRSQVSEVVQILLGVEAEQSAKETQAKDEILALKRQVSSAPPSTSDKDAEIAIMQTEIQMARDEISALKAEVNVTRTELRASEAKNEDLIKTNIRISEGRQRMWETKKFLGDKLKECQFELSKIRHAGKETMKQRRPPRFLSPGLIEDRRPATSTPATASLWGDTF